MQTDLAAQLQFLQEQGVLPPEEAFQRYLREARGLLDRRQMPAAKVFISYAWGPAGSERTQLQDFLLRLKSDLQSLGMTVFLDLEKMTGDMKARMRLGIEDSDYFLLIGTPFYQQKAALDPQSDNVAFEYQHILQKVQATSAPKRDGMIVPLRWRGAFREAFPALVNQYLARDFEDPQSYYNNLMGLTSPLGLVPHLYSMLATDGALHAEYSALYREFENRLHFLAERQQHLLLQTNLSHTLSSGLSQAVSDNSQAAFVGFQNRQGEQVNQSGSREAVQTALTSIIQKVSDGSQAMLFGAQNDDGTQINQAETESRQFLPSRVEQAATSNSQVLYQGNQNQGGIQINGASAEQTNAAIEAALKRFNKGSKK